MLEKQILLKPLHVIDFILKYFNHTYIYQLEQNPFQVKSFNYFYRNQKILMRK